MALYPAMIALIFGVNGQDGFYLSKLLRENQVEAVGVSRSSGDVRGDVAEYDLVEALMIKHQPGYVFHLAANSTTDHAALFENHQAISTGTLNILEAARLHCPNAKVFLSGSAMQFTNRGVPIDENTSFEARSPYAVARIQSVYAGRYYRERFGMKVYTGYFFNHDSPMRTERHVNQKIAAAARRVASGTPEKLIIGNLDVEKEFNFAGDVVEAAWRLVNQHAMFECVIGCGKAYRIKDWLTACFERIGKRWQDYIEVADGFQPEYKVLVSNPRLIKSLGWEPRVGFEELADMMMEGQRA